AEIHSMLASLLTGHALKAESPQRNALFEQALTECDQAIRLEPSSPARLSERARMLSKWAEIDHTDTVKHINDALTDLNTAFHLDPTKLEFKRQVAQLLRRRAKHETK